jgi:phosphinothricin acetyltransferase
MSSIRLANESDAASILNIYAPYIEKTSFTFETEVPSTEEFANRIHSCLQNWPWLVCEINGEVAGYAYGSKYRERTGYQWCAECSVYVHDDFQRKGVAKGLYAALIEILKLQGFRNLYAVINTPNDRSVAFHEQMGFKYFATYQNVGYKLGKWKNVGWWQLQLNDYAMEPAPPIKFPGISQQAIEDILRSAERFLKVSH